MIIRCVFLRWVFRARVGYNAHTRRETNSAKIIELSARQVKIIAHGKKQARVRHGLSGVYYPPKTLTMAHQSTLALRMPKQ